MPKIYTRRTIRGLRDLNREQARVKGLYRDMEAHWFDNLFRSEQLAFSVASALVARKRKKREAAAAPAPRRTKSLFSRLVKKKNEGNASSVTLRQRLQALVAKSRRKKKNKPGRASRFFKRVAYAFVRWQVFNLGYFLGKKLAIAVRKKKCRAPRALTTASKK